MSSTASGVARHRASAAGATDLAAACGFPVVDLTMLNGDDGDGADDLVIGVPVWGDRGNGDLVCGRTDSGCYADCDGSGQLGFFDFLCFQNQFAAGDPRADCDGSGELDFFDSLCFQNAFAKGRP